MLGAVLRCFYVIFILFLLFIAVAAAVTVGVQAGLTAYFGERKKESEDGEEEGRDEDRVILGEGRDDASFGERLGSAEFD